MRRIGGGVLVILLLIGMRTYLRGQRRSDVSATAKTEAMAVIARVENFEANRSYYEGRAEMADLAAMNKSYTVGGRRRPDEFDMDDYLMVFVDRMITLARDEGRSDIVKSLLKLREQEGIPSPQK